MGLDQMGKSIVREASRIQRRSLQSGCIAPEVQKGLAILGFDEERPQFGARSYRRNRTRSSAR